MPANRYVTECCDHRKECCCKSCRLVVVPSGVQGDDIAYREGKHCEHYRSSDMDGTIKGKDVVLVGIWKKNS